jgi:hypothetical protein
MALSIGPTHFGAVTDGTGIDPVARGERRNVVIERDPDGGEESTADRLEDWRRAERDAAAQEQGSALGRLARKAADCARDLFHLREDEADRDAAHPGKPLDRR